MVTYEKLLEELKDSAEPDFAAYQRVMLNDKKLDVLGVRTPVLRRIIQKYKGEWHSVREIPNKYYETVFIKLQLASKLSYAEFILVADECLSALSDWALCDTFVPACIKHHKDEYIAFIEKYSSSPEEFIQRFSFTTLIHFYVEEQYLDFIFKCLARCSFDKYYVLMGAAWLLAEVIIKFYNRGIEFLQCTMCDIKLRNKAISKACDSYRLSAQQKAQLRGIRLFSSKY